MKYLLDTLPFLRWISNAAKLPPAVVDVIKSPDHSIYLSIASVREIQVKSQIGKVDLPSPVLDIVLQQNQANGIEMLQISLAHMVQLTRIPTLHGDPFDYLLISQSIVEDMTIITNDSRITQYPIKTWWGT